LQKTLRFENRKSITAIATADTMEIAEEALKVSHIGQTTWEMNDLFCTDHRFR
jgi:hypothetical protein